MEIREAIAILERISEEIGDDGLSPEQVSDDVKAAVELLVASARSGDNDPIPALIENPSPVHAVLSPDAHLALLEDLIPRLSGAATPELQAVLMSAYALTGMAYAKKHHVRGRELLLRARKIALENGAEREAAMFAETVAAAYGSEVVN